MIHNSVCAIDNHIQIFTDVILYGYRYAIAGRNRTPLCGLGRQSADMQCILLLEYVPDCLVYDLILEGFYDRGDPLLDRYRSARLRAGTVCHCRVCEHGCF